ncbi:MAG: hypothetical protein M3Z04_13930 [Chloroflexota bacterium]|nr:hypothetical protein [Chloroflexota bacterium]
MWLDGIEQAHLHRELAIAILDSALAAPGHKRLFATQVGITPQYLSYLCDPLDPRQPSPALVERLAAALPGNTALRGRLRDHWQAARAGRQAAQHIGRGADTADTLAVALPALRAAREAATFVPDPATAARHYRSVRDRVATLLPTVAPARYPLDYCELCILAHDAECVLNAADRALWYARQAQLVLGALQTRAGRVADPRFAHYRVNIPMAVAVACTNLGLAQRALAAYQAAEAVVAGDDTAAFWLPHLYRGHISTLTKGPRFTLSEVAGYAAQARRYCEQQAAPDAALLLLLLTETEGRAYLRYGNLKRAAAVLDSLPAQADRVAASGPLHHAIIRKTVAALAWARGDRPAWAYWIGQALTHGQSAHLTHQVAGIVRTYGAAVEPILAALDASGSERAK